MISDSMASLIREYNEDRECVRKSGAKIQEVAILDGLDSKSAEDFRVCLAYLRGILKGRASK